MSSQSTYDLAFSRIPDEVSPSVYDSTSSSDSKYNRGGAPVVPTRIPVSTYYTQSRASQVTRPADVTSDPLDHMHGFESEGNVIDRSTVIFKKEEFVSVPDMSDFESQGSVIERSLVYGKQEEKQEEKQEREPDVNFTSEGNIHERAANFERRDQPLETIDEEEDLPQEPRELHGFESQGSVRDRSSLFETQHKLSTIHEDDVKKEPRELHGFQSQGDIRSRMSMFERKKEPEEDDDEVDELPVESKYEPQELHGFESQGSIRSRLSMFQRNEENKQESSTTTTSTSDSSDSDHHHPVKADQEYYARQQQLASLPRSELKVYSYEVLTV